MRNMNIIHKDGNWLVNTAVFRMVDTTNPDEHIVFEPGVPTQVRLTEWMTSQAMIVDSPNPLESDEPVPQVLQPVENTLVPNDDESGEPDVSAAPGMSKSTRKNGK